MADQNEARLTEYYRARDNLDLTVVSAAGERIPTECVHITDFSEETGEVEVAVTLADAESFRHYFEIDG